MKTIVMTKNNDFFMVNMSSKVLVCFVCVDALRPSQQFFSHVGMFYCIPGLNQY